MTVAPEVYFLRYAFPCIFVKLARHEVTQEQVSEFEHAAVSAAIVPRTELAKVFKVAVENIKSIADSLKIDPWSLQAIQEYFIRQHNAYVEKSPTVKLKDLCKVYDAEVIKFLESVGEHKICLVKYAGQNQRNVRADFFPDISVGDKVRIHYAYISEKL